MRPVVKRTADAILDGIDPGQVFVIVFGIPGDEFFLNAIDPHGTPFVMVLSQPQLGQVAVLAVFGNIARIQVAMKVKNRRVFSKLVIKLDRGCTMKQKVLIHKSIHGFFYPWLTMVVRQCMPRGLAPDC
jgi:hypothetical protein